MNVAVHPLVRLRTTCGRELWAGFFGINENGYQPECGCEITEDVEPESLERDEDGTVRPCYAVECPECKGLLEWPHEWEIIETNATAHVRDRSEAEGT
jgi:hypothetical protein